MAAIEADYDVASYRWIGLSILSDTLITALSLSYLIRKKYPTAFLVGGNHESTVNIQDVIGKSSLDGVVLADAEEPMLALMRGTSPHQVPGVLWRTFNPKPSREQFEAWNRTIKYDQIPFRAYWKRTELLYPLAEMSEEDRLTKLQEIRTVRVTSIVACELACTYCFSEGFVHTDRGFRVIGDLVKEDENVPVVQHDGRLGDVVKFSARWYRGPLIKIKLRYNALGLSPTANHPVHVLTSSGEYVSKKAEDITLGDFLRIPLPEGRASQYFDLETLLIEGGQTPLIEGDRMRVKFGKKTFPRKLPWTEQLARFLGLYAAEGHISYFSNRPNSGNLGFTFSAEERHLINFTQSYLEEVFGLQPHLSEVAPTCQVMTGGAALCTVFEVLLGKECADKLLHPILLGLSKKLFFAFVAGWLEGDGHRGSRATKKTLSGTSVSPSLAYGIWLGLLKHGVAAAVQYDDKIETMFIEGRATAQKGSFEIRLLACEGSEEIGMLAFGRDFVIPSRMNYEIKWQNDAVYLPIAEMSRHEFAGTVYNMEVTPAHTYTVNGVAVNNCSVANTRRIASGSMKPTITNLSTNALEETLLEIKNKVPDVMTIYDSSDEAFLGRGRAEEYLATLERIKPQMDAGLERPMRFLIQCRSNDLDYDIIDKAAKVGVKHFTIGVESPIERVRREIKKPQKEEHIRNIIRWCTEKGISAYCLHIMFLPQIQLEELYEAVKNWRLYIELGATISIEPFCNMYLGTAMYDDPTMLTEYSGYTIPFSGGKKLKWATLIWPYDKRVCAVLQYFRETVDEFVVQRLRKLGHKHGFKGASAVALIDCLEETLKLYDQGKVPPWELGSQKTIQRSAVYQDYGDQLSGIEVQQAANEMSRHNKTTTRFNSTHSLLDDPNAGVKGRIKDPGLPHEMLLKKDD